MLLHGEKRRLPALYGVAGRTLAAISPLRELSLMGILVAIRALLEGDGLFEIPICVALFAFDSRVPVFQRILCLRVVELFVNSLQRELFLPVGRMARRVGLRETPVVRIFVAIGA